VKFPYLHINCIKFFTIDFIVHLQKHCYRVNSGRNNCCRIMQVHVGVLKQAVSCWSVVVIVKYLLLVVHCEKDHVESPCVLWCYQDIVRIIKLCPSSWLHRDHQMQEKNCNYVQGSLLSWNVCWQYSVTIPALFLHSVYVSLFITIHSCSHSLCSGVSAVPCILLNSEACAVMNNDLTK